MLSNLRIGSYCGAAAVVVLLMLFACLPCWSFEAEVGKKGTLAVGVFRPTNSGLRDDLGANWFSISVAYKVAETEASESRVEVGWIKSKTGYTDDFDAGLLDPSLEGLDAFFSGKHRMIPVRYTVLQKPPEGRGLYWGGGAGVYFCKTDTSVSITDGEDTVRYPFNKSDTKFGLHIIAGEQFSDALKLELSYIHMFGDTTFAEIDGEKIEESTSGLSLTLSASF